MSSYFLNSTAQNKEHLVDFIFYFLMFFISLQQFNFTFFVKVDIKFIQKQQFNDIVSVQYNHF